MKITLTSQPNRVPSHEDSHLEISFNSFSGNATATVTDNNNSRQLNVYGADEFTRFIHGRVHTAITEALLAKGRF
jgi:hypothetical protein